MQAAFHVRLKLATMLIHWDFPSRSERGLIKHPFSALRSNILVTRKQHRP